MTDIKINPITITTPCRHCDGSGKVYEPMTRERCLVCDGRGWLQSPKLAIRGNLDAKVRIYATDGVYPLSVHGAVQYAGPDTRWEPIQWTASGRWDGDPKPQDSYWDLVMLP